MKLLLLFVVFGFFASKPRAVKVEGPVLIPQAVERVNPPEVEIQPRELKRKED